MAQAVGFQMILNKYKETNDHNLFFYLNDLSKDQRTQIADAIEFLKLNGYAEDVPMMTKGCYNVILKPEAIGYLESILP